MTKLELEDLHPILQAVYETGCEIQHALESSIRSKGVEKTVLDITHNVEENRKKVKSRREVRDHLSGRMIEVV